MPICSFMSYKWCETFTFWASELTPADFFNHATTLQACVSVHFLMVTKTRLSHTYLISEPK